MKGEIINYSAHKDIYFLEANNKTENANLTSLFASPAGREMLKYKPRSKLKHKFNPALELFVENKSTNVSINNGTQKLSTGNDSKSSTSNLSSTTTTTPTATTTTANCRDRRSSIDLYEEAAAILGLTCSQTDDCKCIECQCHYFDFEDDNEYSTADECVVDHNSSCTIQ